MPDRLKYFSWLFRLMGVLLILFALLIAVTFARISRAYPVTLLTFTILGLAVLIAPCFWALADELYLFINIDENTRRLVTLLESEKR